jgi:hypothetical protein
MGKSKKQKKQEGDFKTSKPKLGKKIVANTHTDTSFKSKSIIVPNQSILNEDPVGKQLSHLRHSNANMRKESLINLSNILNNDNYGDILNFAHIIEETIKLILDEDKRVRKALYTFYSNALLKLKSQSFRPFFPTIVVYTSTAMTCIFEDVRNDSLKFIFLFQKLFPDLFFEFGEKIILNFSSLFSDIKKEFIFDVLETLNNFLTEKYLEKHHELSKEKTIFYSEKSEAIFPFVQPFLFFTKDGNGGNEKMKKTLKNGNDSLDLKSFIENIQPIILNIWTESLLSLDDYSKKLQLSSLSLISLFWKIVFEEEKNLLIEDKPWILNHEKILKKRIFIKFPIKGEMLVERNINANISLLVLNFCRFLGKDSHSLKEKTFTLVKNFYMENIKESNGKTISGKKMEIKLLLEELESIEQN